MSDTAVTVRRHAVSHAEASGFARVYERHHQALYRYCRSILRHDQDAQDALQSAMMRAFAALQTDRRELELKPWLFRIAHNEAVSILRRRTATCALDEDLGDGAALEDRVFEREALRQLQADLAGLTERQRWALVLRELNGLSHGEIAAILETSPAVVKQAIFEARSALLRCREGRDTACGEIRRVLSDGDGRVLRARGVRAHLQTCSACRAFRDDLRRRPLRLAALAPPLPAGMAATALRGLLGGSGSATSAGAGLVAKAALGVALAGGAVAWHAHPLMPAHRPDPAPHARAATAPASRAAAPDDVVAAPPPRVAVIPAPHPRATPRHAAPAPHRSRPHRARTEHAAGAAPKPRRAAAPPTGRTERPATRHSGTAPGQAKHAAEVTGATTAPGHSGSAPGQATKTTGTPAAPGHSGTAPGQGKKTTGTPAAPGHSGTAPGRAQTGTPAAPGHSGTAPGRAQSGTPAATTAPGHGGTAPGQARTGSPAATTAPGHGGTAPGQARTGSPAATTAPGHGGTAPGQAEKAAGTPAAAPTAAPAEPAVTAPAGQADPPPASAPGHSGSAPGHGHQG